MMRSQSALPAFLKTLPLIVALFVMANVTLAATWDNDGGDWLWNNPNNWDVALASGATAIFADTSIGTSTNDMADPFTLGSLRFQNTSGTHIVDLNEQTLTIGSTGLRSGYDFDGSVAEITNGTLQFNGPLLVGISNSGVDGNGTVVLTDVTLAGTISQLRVGTRDGSGTWTSTGLVDMSALSGQVFTVGGARHDIGFRSTYGGVLLGDNFTTTIGSQSSRAQLFMEHHGEILAGTGGSAALYLSALSLAKSGTELTKIDFSAVDNGTFDYAGSSFGLQNAELKLGSGWDVKLNQTSGTFTLGSGDGVFSATNANLQGTLSGMEIRGGHFDFGSQGSVDLTVTGQIRVGYNNDSQNPMLTLPTGTVSAGSLHMGHSVPTVATFHGTRVITGGAVTLQGNTMRMNFIIGGESAGLELLDGATISSTGLIESGGGFMITFSQNPDGYRTLTTVDEHDDIFYGLKWKGNQTAALETLWKGPDGTQGNADDRLRWDDSALSGAFANGVRIFYDPGTDASYVGFYTRLAPPGTVIYIR